MTQTPPAATLTQSRLVNQLAEIAGGKLPPREQFAQRLGSLIDLSSSVTLAETLGGLGRAPFEPLPGEPGRAREDFLRVHAAMVGAALRSLNPESGPTRIKWPQRDEDDTPPAPAFGKFYAANQREMEARVRGLQERVRDMIAGASAPLARLAALDEVLGDALLAHSRRVFAGIPGLVEERAKELLGSGDGAGSEDGEAQLKADVQGLLLAEIEARLMPVQGLVEALDEHDQQNPRSSHISHNSHENSEAE